MLYFFEILMLERGVVAEMIVPAHSRSLQVALFDRSHFISF